MPLVLVTDIDLLSKILDYGLILLIQTDDPELEEAIQEAKLIFNQLGKTVLTPTEKKAMIKALEGRG